MITEKDIKTRISEILTDSGFNVVAEEVSEGFTKPAVFVSVYPATVTAEFTAMEHVTDTVEIKYIPSVETTEECADTANTLRSVFMHKTFDISGRHFTIQEMEFDIDKHILYVYFDLEYYQPVETDDEYEEMNELILEGGI